MNTVRSYIAAHWKALMPLVALAISSAVTVATDVDAPAGWKPFALAFGSSILVYLKANKEAVQ